MECTIILFYDFKFFRIKLLELELRINKLERLKIKVNMKIKYIFMMLHIEYIFVNRV